MNTALPRYDYKPDNRDYIVTDRQRCKGDNPIARTPLVEIAELLVKTLNAKG